MTFQEAILAVRGGRDLGATEMVDLMRLIMTGDATGCSDRCPFNGALHEGAKLSMKLLGQPR